MKYITLVENADSITDLRFRQLFLSKIEQLERVVSFFERKQITATIKITGSVKEEQLHTTIEVMCDDPVYKKTIEQSIKSLNTPPDL